MNPICGDTLPNHLQRAKTMLKKIPFVFLFAVIVSAIISGCSSDPNECKEGETKCDGKLGYYCVWDEDEEIWKWHWYDCLLGCTEDGKDCRKDNCEQGAYQCAADGTTLQRCNAFLFEEVFPNAVDSDYWKEQIGKPTSGVGHWVDLETCHSGCSDDHCNPDIYENDANNNHMFDQYETAADQGKDCMLYSDCTEFCDSLIGYKCSTKCTSNDQCVSDKYICRPDGRCAKKYFESVWEPVVNYYGTISFNIPFKTENFDKSIPCDITIDWGDGTAPQHYTEWPETFSHKYKESNIFHIRIDGVFQNFTPYEASLNGKFLRIESFGQVKLAHDAFGEAYGKAVIREGQLPQNDIPDATLLTDTSDMFAHHCYAVYERDETINPEVEMWDTHYVTNMESMFYNACAFRRDISKWDTSNVRNMNMAFYNTDEFNIDLSSWDLSSIETCIEPFYGSGLSEENRARMTNWANKCEYF